MISLRYFLTCYLQKYGIFFFWTLGIFFRWLCYYWGWVLLYRGPRTYFVLLVILNLLSTVHLQTYFVCFLEKCVLLSPAFRPYNSTSWKCFSWLCFISFLICKLLMSHTNFSKYNSRFISPCNYKVSYYTLIRMLHSFFYLNLSIGFLIDKISLGHYVMFNIKFSFN